MQDDDNVIEIELEPEPKPKRKAAKASSGRKATRPPRGIDEVRAAEQAAASK